ncbi:WXG100 family type VII secretion target [Streptomyces sp. NPDC044984]|uniref:WXG100 family type VII secretion target n=1 Tax=Streptomyces sp. NPDC044984 TaxID=3154335 RepID=UPI00340CB081
MSNFSDGYIHVDFLHADNAGQDMIQQSQAIANIVAHLENELSELKQSWIGEDKDAYTEVQKAWDTAVDNISKLLGQYQLLLQEITGDYSRQARSRSEAWQSVKIGA